MTTKEKILAAQMLNEAADVYGDKSCNDWEWPKDWTHEERVIFCREYHAWNCDPESFSESHLHLPDYAVMKFLASKLYVQLGLDTTTQ